MKIIYTKKILERAYWTWDIYHPFDVLPVGQAGELNEEREIDIILGLHRHGIKNIIRKPFSE